MRIRFFQEESFNAVPIDEDVELCLFGFQGPPAVSYEKELKGESDFFEEGALLSKRTQSVVVCGCITDSRGRKRKSAFIAEQGRLLGVSDRVHTMGGEYASGADARVYETSVGKMGVLVGEDLYFPELIHALALCSADFIVCPFEEVGELPVTLARAAAFSYGVPILLSGRKGGVIADPSGEIAFSASEPAAFVEYVPTREYHVLETRRRSGFLL